ncbi:MAG: nucleotidyltransferase family protein [Gemmatimonadota bacterium]|nr:nucleotidyltransferase family protein [Gemmatimonadota bacterium]
MRPELEAVATPEMLLLCSIARLEMDEASEARLDRALGRGIDWDRLGPLAEFHGLRPLLYRHLGQREDGRVPESARAAMKRDAHAIAAKNLGMARELVDLTNLLSTAGVESVPLKGPVLAEAVYGSHAMREFGDLDIAVRPRDLDRALDALAEVGFRSTTGLGRRADRVVHRASGAVPLRRLGSGPLVEVHWSLMPRYRPGLTLEDVWGRRGSEVLMDRPIASLDPEDRFIALAVHGGKHAWGSLGWLVDVAEAGRPGRLDRRAVSARAVAAQVTRSVELASSLADDVLAAAHGIEWSDTAKDLANDLGKRLVSEVAPPYPPNSAADHRFFLGVRETMAQRAAYLSGLVLAPMPADAAAVRLPDRLAFLYRVVRPARLVTRTVARSTRRHRARAPHGDAMERAA